MLYLVPSPIGNLGDITYRAVEVLRTVNYILAEDTRVTGRLLQHYQIATPLRAFHAHNEHRTVEKVLEELRAGKTIAQVSDAGTPGISDPGFLLARACAEANIKFEILPGATAFIPALLQSGFACDCFLFEGFLPHKKGRVTKIEGFKEETRTVILYESPHRMLKCLEQFSVILGDERRVSVSRELTKMFEETVRGTIAEVKAHFENKKPRGEFVVVLEGVKLEKKRKKKYEND